MILVTGATGTIGSQVVAELARAHVPARALIRSPDRAADLPDGIEPAVGDLERLDGALDDVESLFLLSPASEDTARLEAAAIDAARRAGVEHVVKISVVGAAAHAPVRFSRQHGEVVEYLKSSGMKWTIVAPTDYMANVLNQAQSVREGAALYTAEANADAPVASVHPADVGAVAATVLQGGYEGEELIVSGPDACTPREVAAKLSTVLGREIQLVALDDEALRTGMLAGGVPEWNAEGTLELFAAYRSGLVAEPTGTAEAVVGRPSRTWEDFLRENAGAF